MPHLAHIELAVTSVIPTKQWGNDLSPSQIEENIRADLAHRLNVIRGDYHITEIKITNIQEI